MSIVMLFTATIGTVVTLNCNGKVVCHSNSSKKRSDLSTEFHKQNTFYLNTRPNFISVQCKPTPKAESFANQLFHRIAPPHPTRILHVLHLLRNPSIFTPLCLFPVETLDFNIKMSLEIPVLPQQAHRGKCLHFARRENTCSGYESPQASQSGNERSPPKKKLDIINSSSNYANSSQSCAWIVL